MELMHEFVAVTTSMVEEKAASFDRDETFNLYEEQITCLRQDILKFTARNYWQLNGFYKSAWMQGLLDDVLHNALITCDGQNELLASTELKADYTKRVHDILRG